MRSVFFIANSREEIPAKRAATARRNIKRVSLHSQKYLFNFLGLSRADEQKTNSTLYKDMLRSRVSSRARAT